MSHNFAVIQFIKGSDIAVGDFRLVEVPEDKRDNWEIQRTVTYRKRKGLVVGLITEDECLHFGTDLLIALKGRDFFNDNNFNRLFNNLKDQQKEAEDEIRKPVGQPNRDLGTPTLTPTRTGHAQSTEQQEEIQSTVLQLLREAVASNTRLENCNRELKHLISTTDRGLEELKGLKEQMRELKHHMSTLNRGVEGPNRQELNGKVKGDDWENDDDPFTREIREDLKETKTHSEFIRVGMKRKFGEDLVKKRLYREPRSLSRENRREQEEAEEKGLLLDKTFVDNLLKAAGKRFKMGHPILREGLRKHLRYEKKKSSKMTNISI